MAIGPDRRTMTPTQARTAEVDVGLRSYMLRVYNYMALGVAFTGIVSMVVAMNPEFMMTMVSGPMMWVMFFGIIGMGFVVPWVIRTGSIGMAQVGFWVYAGLWGIWIAPLFYIYTGDSIARVFFITAGAFAGMSLFGYTTKRNLGPIGAFLCMATFGLLIAYLVNIFLVQSEVFDLLVSIAVVLVFAGLTAYDTQWIKNAYYQADEGDVMTRKAIFGAFHLYGDFVVMFVWIMHLLGVMRE